MYALCKITTTSAATSIRSTCSDPFPLLARARREQSGLLQPGHRLLGRHPLTPISKPSSATTRPYTAANTITPIVPFPAAVKQMLADGNYSPEPVLSNKRSAQPHADSYALVNRLFTPRRMKSFAPAILATSPSVAVSNIAESIARRSISWRR